MKYRQYNAIFVVLFFSILIIGILLPIYPSTVNAQQKHPNDNNNKTILQQHQLTQKQIIPTITITIPFSAGVKTLDTYYQPTVITIQTGSKITWKNDDISPHTATSLANDSNSSNNGKIFDTGIFTPGTSKSIIVNGTGTVNYYCSIHPWMKGTITVVKSLNDKYTVIPYNYNQRNTNKSCHYNNL